MPKEIVFELKLTISIIILVNTINAPLQYGFMQIFKEN